ncbi:MAG: hypothetical protein HN368_19750 [Spirochaetales bacterium]|jgi:hypothetical protein|nr:hypothetical protein [Spirochaetales bacterium]
MPDRGNLSKFYLYGHCIESDFLFTIRLEPASGPVELSITATAGRRSPLLPVMSDWELAYPQTIGLKSDGSGVYLYRKGETYRFRFIGTADFFVRRDSIEYHSDPDCPPEVLELCLLGIVMAFWLELTGVVALHASAVVIDGGAVCFCRGNSPGKSTTAMQFLTSGYSMLTDDILPLRIHNGAAIGYSGYPQARLWPEEAIHFFGSVQDFRIVHPGYRKLRIPAGNGECVKFTNDKMPIRVLYLLDDILPAGSSCPTIQPVSSGESVITLIRSAFIPEMIEVSGLQYSRLGVLSKLAEEIPVRRIFKPTGYEHLPELMDAVLKDLNVT